jgi:predicted restriction endonuclease
VKISDSLQIYKDKTAVGTYKAHIAKIEEFMLKVEDIELPDALDVMFLRDYIFTGNDKKARGKYDALVSYYSFVHSFYYDTPKNRVVFPIDINEVKEFDAKSQINNNRGSGKTEILYLDKSFNLTKLFDDVYYQHMVSEEAIITAKAAISLSLGAGYDSGELFNSNSPPKMKLSDINICEDKVTVTNFYNSNINKINVGGYLAEILNKYYKLRLSFTNVQESEKDYFFIKMWDAKELQYDSTIKTHKNSKPYSVQQLVYYILKYISREIGIEGNISVTDLRYNMVLHMLYQSKGSALKEIIKTFGLINFVQDVISEYVSFDNSMSEFMFTEKSFFEYTPSDEFGTDELTGGVITRKEVMINKICRDSKVIKKLKKIYDNRCQICGETITLIDEIKYSEGCHIQPLGEHNGFDHESNIIILCPNHHKLLDLGVISIDPHSMKKLVHVDSSNLLNNIEIRVLLHNLSGAAIQYHYDNIFIKN